jgi:hypothetical protein
MFAMNEPSQSVRVSCVPSNNRLLMLSCMLGLGLALTCGGCRRSGTSTSNTDSLPDPGRSETSKSVTPSSHAVTGDDADATEGLGSPPDAKDGPMELVDLSQIKVDAGMPSPTPGDKIYTMDNLPRTACGIYWVMDSKGYVARLAVCTHADGHH